jgi:hypothetical protein
MARYYFDVLNGKQLVQDDEGSEFDSLDAAIQGAARSAAEIGTDRLARGDTSHVVLARLWPIRLLGRVRRPGIAEVPARVLVFCSDVGT